MTRYLSFLFFGDSSTAASFGRLPRGLTMSLCVCLVSSTLLLAAATAHGQQSPVEAVNMYAEAAGYQNGGQFDLAAAEWEKFLKRFPQDPLAAKARHYAGVCRLQLGDHAAAAKHFEEVVKDADFEFAEEALLNLGWCQYTLGGDGQADLFAQAEKTFDQLVKKFPAGKLTDQALFYAGEAKYAQGKSEEAIAAYRQLVDTQEESSLRCNALYAWGVTEEQLKRYDAAGELYDRFLADCGDHPLATEVRMRKAETVFQRGDLEQAQTMFAEIASDTDFAAADNAAFRAADCAAGREQFAEAGKLYVAVIDRFPESAFADDARIAAGRAFFRAGDFEQALPTLQKSYSAGGKHAAEAAHWLCRILLRQDQPAKAVQLAQRALPGAESSSFALDLKMDEADGLYAQPGSRAGSLDKYLAIVKSQPDHRLAPQALYNAAFTALQLKKFDQGLALAEEFAGKFPEDSLAPDAASVRAESLLLLRRFDDAQTAYGELVERFPEHAETDYWTIRRGLALFADKRYADVVAKLDPAIGKLDDANFKAEGAYLVGASHFRLGQMKPAITSLEASRAASTNWRKADETLLLLSQAQAGDGQLDKARRSVEKLLADYPQSGSLDQAHYRLGKYAEAAGDHTAAATSFGTVVDSYADSAYAPYAAYSRGWALLKNGKTEESVASFTTVIDKWPTHTLVAEARLGRGTSERLLGQHDKALADIDEYLKSNPQGDARLDALYERGQAQVGLKQYAEAAETFQSILAANPDYPAAEKVLYQLAWAFKDLGEDDQARDAFAKIVADHAEGTHAAEANFHVGEGQYNGGDYDAAATSYAAAKKGAARPELAEQATHKLGWTRFRQGAFDAALAEFDQQLKEHPTGPLASDARFMKGECLFRDNQFEPALASFTVALKTPPESPQMQVLLMLHGGQSAAQLEKWQEALDFVGTIPDKYPETTLLAEALFERGRARQNLGQLEDATTDFERAATLSRGAVGARSRFMLGELQFQQKEFEKAIETFRRVMFGFGGENAPEDVKPWQATAGFEAGRCAESLIKDASADQRAGRIANAQEFYQYVVDKHPESEYAPKARMRLQGLARLANG